MKTKVLFFMLASCVLALAAWVVHVPNPAKADEIPEKYRETVYKGLEYLVKNQFKDGHWEGDGGKHPVAMTGLAGLALLMECKIQEPTGRRPERVRETKYSANIRKAVDWLMDKSQAGRDGLIFSEHASETARYMEGHGLATLFLAGACEEEKDSAHREKLTAILTQAVKYIVKAQSTQGGWYHTSRVEGHDFAEISVTVIQIQALQAAEDAGIPVPSEAMNDGQEYLKMALGKYGQGAGPGQNRSRPAETAAALACRFGPSGKVGGRASDTMDEVSGKWFKALQGEIPLGRALRFGRDELIHYYYAQVVFNLGGDTWTGYRTAMFDHLQSSQNKDGSWPAGNGIGVGLVYATAVWCTILQLDKRAHPLMRQRIYVVTQRDDRGREPWPGLGFALKSA